MEGVQSERNDEVLKSQVAIRCAKAALFLSSLKSVANHTSRSAEYYEDEEKEMLMKAMADLKIELVRERMKSKRIENCGLVETLVQLVGMANRAVQRHCS